MLRFGYAELLTPTPLKPCYIINGWCLIVMNINILRNISANYDKRIYFETRKMARSRNEKIWYFCSPFITLHYSKKIHRKALVAKFFSIIRPLVTFRENFSLTDTPQVILVLFTPFSSFYHVRGREKGWSQTCRQNKDIII